MSFALLSYNFIDLLQFEYPTSQQTIDIAFINIKTNVQFLFKRYAVKIYYRISKQLKLDQFKTSTRNHRKSDNTYF